MRSFCCLLAVSFLISCSSCAQKPAETTSAAIYSQESTLQAVLTTTAAAATNPGILIGTVSSLEDAYAYVRTSPSSSAEVVGAAVTGIEFLITKQENGWCSVVYDDNESGFIQTKYLDISETTELPAVHKAYYYLPEKEEIGLVGTKFNNRLTVSAVDNRLDVYTESGILIAEDAVPVLHDAVIDAPALPVAAIPTASTVPGETGPAEAEGTAQAATEPSPSPTPVPIRIVIQEGKIVSCQGITLDANSPFVIGEESGQVLSEDNTVIASNGSFLHNAVISVTYGSIFTSSGEIEIEPDYYFVPKLLKDNLVDVSRYSSDIKIDLLLATDNNFLDSNVYGKAACFLQEGTLEKLMEAQEKFAEDGYTIIIYDAYRPYSVTLLLYEKYQNGTYVAGPRIGSVHNKGAAIDMSLLDKNGNPLEMPSLIHTLDSTSNRDNPNMSDTAKANMEYMAGIMRSCGFSTINSEWWHFSDTEYNNYLRTDYDLKTVLQVIFS